MSKNTEITILTPTYDDWESVLVLLGQLDKVLAADGLMANVIIIDDGSSVFADTQDFGSLTISAIQEVEVITLTRNMGNQRALATGIAYVAENRDCEILIVMDSDLEDQPKYVTELIAEAIKTGNEVIFAERTQRSEGFTFKAFYKIYKYLYKVLTGMPISIGNFSAIPGRLVKRIANISEIWSHFPAGIMRAQIPFRSIPAARGQRLHGESKMNLVALVVHGMNGFAVHADVVGVRMVIAIFGIGGVILLALLLTIAKRFAFDFFVVGWTSMVVIILSIAVIQAFMAAIFMAFVIVSNRNQRVVIPAIDFKKYILETNRVYPKP
jgi:ethanolamine utilization protein EutP (predicted NTPase)